MELNEKQQKKVDKLSLHLEDKDVALHQEIVEINDHLEAIHENLEKIAEKEPMEMPEIHKIKIDGFDAIQIKGDKGDTGEKGEQGERGLDGKDGKNGLDGLNGIDGKDGVDGKNGENGKDGSPDTAEDIVKKLETLDGDDRLDKSAIKGLDEEFKRIEKIKSASGGVRRVYQPYRDKFTSQTDGVTKTFYLSREPLQTNTIMVFGTDFPIILDPDTDFTVAGKALTLTSAVPAPSAGSTLIVIFFA